ncbi:hypothetical protein WJX75_008521 [Coccomyxa subellipsoidea]|uniref:SRCR domain-containing protein n=1 Tax=Coccomyxa subellipsoidea TaxID=248742 RepID=A0ABR2YRY3_9CHLO
MDPATVASVLRLNVFLYSALVFCKEDTAIASVAAYVSATTPAAWRKKARRARILQDGRLTMILYGADEALKWQMRVSRFLQAARGVLGDRRRVPGQWAGSVLDSVVGVFLTQNVSDALSSKAWMTLAATFPLAATGNQQQERGGSSVAGDALTGTARITCNGQLDCEQGVEYLCETAGEKAPAANASDVASHDRRCRDTADSIDWEAVRAAQTDEVAAAIKCRGMHNKLAARLQVTWSF